MLPALERLGVEVHVDEPAIVEASPPVVEPQHAGQAPDWPTALRWLAQGWLCTLPEVPAHPKAQRLAARYAAACEAGSPDGMVDAFDRALELAWCAGQAKESWATALRELTRPVPTTPP